VSDFWIEAIVAAAYIVFFGVTIHGWREPKAYAVAPELSVVVTVLYARIIIEALGTYGDLAHAALTPQTIHAMFRIPEAAVVILAVPGLVFWIVVNLVRSYEGVDVEPDDLVQLVWRANAFAVLLCIATNIAASYISVG
jgi:hypothetical protein